VCPETTIKCLEIRQEDARKRVFRDGRWDFVLQLQLNKSRANANTRHHAAYHQLLILLSAGAASAALNEPCYGPGGSAGAFPVLLPHPPRHQTLTQVRRLRAYVCLYLIRWHIHQRWLSAGRSRREVLQQAQMQQRTLRQLPLGQQLSRPQQHR